MMVSGSATLNASPDAVWRALNDPAVLVRTIPGCQRLEAVGEDAYTMTVTAGVASIKGVYTGQVRLSDHQPPDSFVLTASGSGAPGTVSADVRVKLTDAGGGTTSLSYDADAIVGGMIGGVGQRMLTGVAKKTAGEFFAAVDDVLNGRAAAPAAAATAGTTTASGADGAAAADRLRGSRRRGGPAESGRLRAGGLGRSRSGADRCPGRRLAVRTETARLMRAFTAAAVQVAAPAGTADRRVDRRERRALRRLGARLRPRAGAELVVLPETVHHRLHPRHRPRRAVGPGRRDPRRQNEPLQDVAAGSACTSSSAPTSAGPRAAWSTTRRCWSARTARSPASTARPTRSAPRCVTGGGWVTPGDEVCVVETELGRHRPDHLLRRRLPRAGPDHGAAAARR